MERYDVIVVGGGAAGLLCAGFAARKGVRVLIVERGPRSARKVLITGKGRCNVTNACEPDEFIQQVRTNPRFLYAAINAFTPAQAIELFEKLGVPLKTERGRRVFPVSDRAADIAEAMRAFAADAGAELMTQERVVGIETRDEQVYGVLLEEGKRLEADSVVIATGGRSYPATGSSGDGYRLARELGHTIMAQRPSLAPIVTEEPWCEKAMGLALRNVTLTLQNKEGKVLFSELGEMLFTHFGISGPLTLSASAYMTGCMSDYRLLIDLKPGLDDQQLDARLLRDFEQFKNRDFSNALGLLLPRALIPVVVALSGIPDDCKVHSITREQRRSLIDLLHALALTPKAFGPIEEAIITSGGISVKEIDPKTMQSKLVSGLYFAGEVIDVDAFTGGYNLQIAYSTAYLAAREIVKQLQEKRTGA